MDTAKRASNARIVAPQRAAFGLAVLLALLAPGQALASPDEPDAAKIREAAQAFDAGTLAQDEGRYEDAAAKFEAADELAPSAAALRAALRARMKAGQGDRAATLAAQAQRRYPDDPKLAKLAGEAIARYESGLHAVEVTCSRECVLACNGRAVPGPPSKQWVVYAEPGKAALSASFPDGAGADSQVLSTKAGGRNSVHFMPETKGEPEGKPDKSAAPAPTSAAASSPGELPPEQEPTQPPAADDEGGSSGWSPAVFVVGLGATLVFGGVTIWSGVDTLNDPGTDTVREACRGLGEGCPEYQLGLEKETRTNALIGVTAGLGVLTAVVGLFLTDWGGDDDAQPESGATAFVPIRLAPARDGTLGLTGTF